MGAGAFLAVAAVPFFWPTAELARTTDNTIASHPNLMSSLSIFENEVRRFSAYDKGRKWSLDRVGVDRAPLIDESQFVGCGNVHS
jgi:hypothetical protein